jgi:glycolate oxidase iron-sulfur subunit
MAHSDNTNRAAAIFDEHNPPPAELYNKCVHCGFCLTTCPTYALWGEEMDSPRGRIYLMKMGAEGKARLTDNYVQHFDQCLGCMACVTACPSGVQYGKLIEATRAQLERHYRRSPGELLQRQMIFNLFPYPDRLRAALWPAWFYQASGLRKLVRGSGLVKLLPRKLRSMEALLPSVSLSELRADIPARIPAQGPVRRRVGLLTGCVQRVLFSGVNAATARVLAAEGCEVIIPRDQGCCGALMVHAGQEEQALEFARKLIDSFERAGVDAIVINAAGCGSTMKDYGYILRNDPRYAERAKAFSAKCKDVSEVLAELEPRATRHPMPLRIAYHDSCHLQHAQGIRTEPRKVLKTIPQLELLEIPDSAICCGSAGIYNLVQPETAAQLGDLKVKNCLSTKPDLVVSANPGCLIQISSGLKRAGKQIPVLHMIELMDAAIRGVPAAQLQADGHKK